MNKFSLMLLNAWIRSGRDTKCQPIKSLFPSLGTKLTEVKFLMHIISLLDVRCLIVRSRVREKLKGWVNRHFF